VIAVANRLGITSNLAPDASIALGTNEVNLLELVSAYAPFANGGNGVLAYGITEITDTSGQVLYRRSGSGPGQVIPPDEVGLMDGMLAGVIARGTGKAAALPRPVAGKTGTTQDYKDAWFIGFTADLVAGVWLGNDDNTPMNKVTGGTLPAPVWKNFMLAATQGMPIKALPSASFVQAAGQPAAQPVSSPGPATTLDQLFGRVAAPTGPPTPLIPVGTALPPPRD
jgi:penicillin-binding protein 1A